MSSRRKSGPPTARCDRSPYHAAAPPVRRGSLAEIPFDNAREAPADAVLSRKQPDGGWRDVSAADFADEVLAVAKGLIAEGLGAG